jgi:hypothetical protein
MNYRRNQNSEQKVSEFGPDIDQNFAALRSCFDRGFTQMDKTLRLHTWLLGTILAFVIALFFKEFSR